MLWQKQTQILPWKLLKEATIHFYCLFHESHFSEICTMMELKEINNCVNIWKTSEVANLVFQWIFVLNSVKHKFFPVSIVKPSLVRLQDTKNKVWMINFYVLSYIENQDGRFIGWGIGWGGGGGVMKNAAVTFSVPKSNYEWALICIKLLNMFVSIWHLSNFYVF